MNARAELRARRARGSARMHSLLVPSLTYITTETAVSNVNAASCIDDRSLCLSPITEPNWPGQSLTAHPFSQRSSVLSAHPKSSDPNCYLHHVCSSLAFKIHIFPPLPHPPRPLSLSLAGSRTSYPCSYFLLVLFLCFLFCVSPVRNLGSV